MNIALHLQQRTLLGTCATLCIFVVITLTYAIWQWHDDWLLAHQEWTGRSSIASKDETALMIAAIPNAHVFGKSFAKTGVPLTNLQFRVTGIVKVDKKTGTPSKAYISIGGQPSKIYQIGDNLPYGVKIYDITSTAIILENNGRLEKLLLPREKLKFKDKLELANGPVVF